MNEDLSVFKDTGTSTPNAKLYAFLATNYDISNLASQINATKYAPMAKLRLKGLSSNPLSI